MRQYQLLKQELQVLEEEKRAIYEQVPNASASWGELRAKAFSDAQSGKLFRLMRLEEQWREVAFYVQAVDDLLAYLDEERRQLVELYYFKGWQPWQVIDKLGISETTFKRRHVEVINLLAHRLGLVSEPLRLYGIGEEISTT